VRGGQSGPAAGTFKIFQDGREEKLPGVVACELAPGEWIRGVDAGGGGYGNPLERDPARVLRDVLERWETLQRAHEVYGVVLTGELADHSLRVDEPATAALRQRLLA
jgi:N-methylhydantoinase B